MNFQRHLLVGLACLLTAGQTAASLAGEGEQANRPTAAERVRQNVRKLWRAGVEAPEETARHSGLQEAIRKLKSIRLVDTAQPIQAATSQPTTVPAPARARGTSRPSRPSYRRGLDQEALAKLKTIPPKSVANPSSLADALYLGGYYGVAGRFYELALERSGEGAGTDWLLFQIGNCFRPNDPAAALGVYRRLIAQHPDSLWSSLADSRARLIEWYQVNPPRAVLAKQAPEVGRMRPPEKTNTQ